MVAKSRNWKLTWRFRVKMPGPVFTGQRLFIYFLLQSDQGMKQRLGPRRAAWNVHIHWYVPINAFEDIVTLLERSARYGTGAHGNDVFGIGHLIIEPDHLGSHLLSHCAGHNHEIGLAR